MSHFAKIDNDGVVTEIIRATQQEINSGTFGDVFRWVQTSYNKNFRKNFAGIGYTYDRTRDAFIPPEKPPSWTLDEDTCQWQPPVAEPTDGGAYEWDETTTSWVEVTGAI